MYSHSSWKNYWEGTLKRDNLNLGRVSTNAYSVMGNYGVTRKLNLLFSLPYIKTKASAGRFHQRIQRNSGSQLICQMEGLS